MYVNLLDHRRLVPGNIVTFIFLNSVLPISNILDSIYCVKSVQINLKYPVNLRIKSEYRKIRTRSNSVFGHFSRSDFIFSVNL